MYLDNSSTSQFYEELKDVGYSPFLIALGGIKALIAIVGILLNLSLILTTVLSRSLHGSCNILLATDSLGFALYLISPLISLAISLSGSNFVPLRHCFLLQIVPMLGLNISFGMMLFIAGERWLSITFPLWFNSLRPSRYLSLVMAFSLLIASYNIYRLYLSALDDGDIMVMCHFTDCYRDVAGQQVYISGLISLCVCVCCYLDIWAQMKLKQSSEKASASSISTRHLFKSLLVLISIIVCGWMMDILGRLVLLPLLPNSSSSSSYSLVLSFLFSNFALLASASNTPVLYTFSRDYHLAYNLLANRFFAFAKLNGWFHLNTAITGTTSQMPGGTLAQRRISRKIIHISAQLSPKSTVPSLSPVAVAGLATKWSVIVAVFRRILRLRSVARRKKQIGSLGAVKIAWIDDGPGAISKY